MARIANWNRLKPWAFIQSVSNFSHGVGKSEEMAFANFGPFISYTTQHRIMARLMGPDKKSTAKKNTLVDKQTKLLSVV